MIPNYMQHAANERTFLAWVRTAMAIVGVGLVVARLGNLDTPLWSEVALLAVGALVVFLAFLRMRSVCIRINAEETTPYTGVPADLFLMFVVAGLFGLVAVFIVQVH